MKMLVSTTQTQGERSNDFCFVPEDEIVMFSLECDHDTGPDGDCGCIRSMCGIVSKKATTTVKVKDVPGMTIPKFGAMIRKYYLNHFQFTLSESDCDAEAARIQSVALAFKLGSVLEKRDVARDENPSKAFRVRSIKNA